MMVSGIFNYALVTMMVFSFSVDGSVKSDPVLKKEDNEKMNNAKASMRFITSVKDAIGNDYIDPSTRVINEGSSISKGNVVDVPMNHLRVESSSFVTLHNHVRESVAPKATPALPSVSTSASLESFARTHAQDCVFEHGGPNIKTNYYGQNIYANSGYAPTSDEIVKAWAVEADDYDYNSNTCKTGKICGHYTQLVWRSSTSIGCYINKCTSNSPFGSTMSEWYFAVCNYLAPGNYAGQKPY